MTDEDDTQPGKPKPDDETKQPRWTWVHEPAVVITAEGVQAASIRMRRHHCEAGDYPWDHWFERAKAAGLAEDLAQLGRSVMREADQHVWPQDMQAECGWDDDGAAMLEFALVNPTAAQRRWEWLMDVDGAPGFSTGPDDDGDIDDA
jgi:hypothetical protein